MAEVRQIESVDTGQCWRVECNQIPTEPEQRAPNEAKHGPHLVFSFISSTNQSMSTTPGLDKHGENHTYLRSNFSWYAPSNPARFTFPTPSVLIDVCLQNIFFSHPFTTWIW